MRVSLALAIVVAAGLWWRTAATAQTPTPGELSVETPNAAAAPGSNSLSVAPEASAPPPATEPVQPAAVATTAPAPSLAVPSSVTPAPVTPAPVAQPTSVQPGHRGRIVLLMLGGVTWSDLSAAATATGANTPSLRGVLESGDLAAARLEGSGFSEPPNTRSRVRVSPAILQAAATLSSGTTHRSVVALPPSTAFTLGAGEKLAGVMPAYEDDKAVHVYARRTGMAAAPGSLLNMGWGELPVAPGNEESIDQLGALADVIHGAGGRTMALGGADTLLAGGLPLREWALSVTDSRGTVDGGEIGRRLLARDSAAPFGLRTNRKLLAARVNAALRDPEVSLISIEWGDCRRAALYSAWANAGWAASYRQNALGGVDALLQQLVSKLHNPGDRLVIVAVPDIDERAAQWLPVVLWRPLQRGSGSLLRTTERGAQPGVIPLGAIHWSLIRKFGAPVPRDTAWLQETPGEPLSAAVRIARLQSFEQGRHWMAAAQPRAHGLLAALYGMALLCSVWLLAGIGRGGGADGVLAPLPRSRLGHFRLARVLWIIAMATPVALFLAGPCLQIAWQYGPGLFERAPGQTGSAAGAYVIALFALAVFALGALLATASWFYPARLRRVRIGGLWLVFLLCSLAAHGFALPWNRLLSVDDGEAHRAGQVFALLVLSATLVGVAGLTRSWYKGAGLADAAADRRTRTARRVINLRSAAYWMLLVPILLWWDWAGNNTTAAALAVLTLGALWLRLKLQSHDRPERLVWRRTIAIGIVLLILVVQRNSGNTQVAAWLPDWLTTWRLPWWDAALGVVVVASIVLATLARLPLRNYFETRYTSRAMAAATVFGSCAALLIYGSYGPPLIAFYPLGALLYEMLSAQIDHTNA